MGMSILLDAAARTPLADDLVRRISALARDNGIECSVIELSGDEVPPCTGCLLCLTKHPGRCVYARPIAAIAERAAGSTIMVFLTPVLFGNFSSTIKNVIDRGGLVVPNADTCLQIILGYAEDASEEERLTFIDLTAKHRGRADIVHPTMRGRVEVFFSGSIDESQVLGRELGALVAQEAPRSDGVSHD
jgi:multimeric flavodoxin WrbA